MNIQPLPRETLIEVRKTILGILKYSPKSGKTEALERILSRAEKAESGGIFTPDVLREINQRRGETPVDKYLLLHKKIYEAIGQYLPDRFKIKESITDLV